MLTDNTIPLRNILAVTLNLIDTDNGYISPQRSATANTQLKVSQTLKQNKTPPLDDYYWRFADEIISVFRTLRQLPIYKTISTGSDSAQYNACIDVAQHDDTTSIAFTTAVQMAISYGTLRRLMEKLAVDPDKMDTLIAKPNDFIGTLNLPSRFFVKLVSVGEHDASKGGCVFQVHDRHSNIGFFYERPDRLKGKLILNDCFSMIGTPSRQTIDQETGEKHTVFRSVQFVENKGPGTGKIPNTNDITGMFRDK